MDQQRNRVSAVIIEIIRFFIIIILTEICIALRVFST